MEKSKLLLCVFASLMGLNVQSQVTEVKNISKVENADALPYKDKKGNYLGCGYTYECRGMSIVFYQVVLNRDLNRIKIKGRVFDPRISDDTIGIYAVNIFLAKPLKSRLSQIRPISSTYIEQDDYSKRSFPHRNGDFEIEVSFHHKDRLYFTHGLYWPIEYHLGKL